MTEEIKRRIRQINSGEVPKGYKKTTIGIVPEEWSKKKLNDLLSFKNGINADKEKFGSGIKLIGVMDILAGRPILYDTIKAYIDIDNRTLENYSVTYGDILFQRSSETFEDAGKSNVYLDKNNTVTYSGFVIRGKKIAEYNPIYLNELLKTTQIRKQIIRSAAGSQHINIGQESLSKIQLYVARDKEQQRISDILSKCDEAISLQEKLIKKLELQKKALMQKLLTPKEGWKPMPLKKILKERKLFSAKGFRYTHVTLSKEGICDKTDQYNRDFLVASEDKRYKITHLNDLCYNPANLKFGVICLNKYGDAIFSPIYVTFEISKKFNFDFIGAVLTSYNFVEKIRRYEEGSLYERQAVKPKDFIRDSILVPNIETQNSISKILIYLDEKILLETKKLNKLKQQQKAMQQLLLTGIVRV